MIQLDRVELLHWDIQRHQVLPFSKGVTIITGENGSGKTCVLDAIKVGLGARHPSSERKVEDYILKQARPVSMVRILVDNRPNPTTKRRPFDPLGAYGLDIVTLAVVFRAVDEGEYKREYFILDGDVVPLASTPGSGAKSGGSVAKPLATATEYRERLLKIGIGPRYLKLLMLPQGRVAQLCSMNPQELFDYLFDIIGGRSVLEKWEARIREVSEREREHDNVQANLRKSSQGLEILRRKVERFHEFEGYRRRAQNFRAALPHRLLKEASNKSSELDAQEKIAKENLLRTRQNHSDGLDRIHQDTDRQKETEMREGDLKTEIATTRMRQDRVTGELAEARARLGQLQIIKTAAEGIAPLDPAMLEDDVQLLRIEVATGDAEQNKRDETSHSLLDELSSIKKGLLPLPSEVQDFRAVLHNAGIPHHILSEVLEVKSADWASPLEGYLGRLRFSVLVQDPTMWSEAAALGRKHKYPHGVLAPDIRGSSPADAVSLAAILEIKEARYRSLLARLLRRVNPGEPSSPLAPTRDRNVTLAQDGFVVSRTEAYCVEADRLYLGRSALEKRKQQIREEQKSLDEITYKWKSYRQSLDNKIEDIEISIAQQKKRLEWEKAQDSFASAIEDVARLEGAKSIIEEEICTMESQLDSCRASLVTIKSNLNVAKEQVRVAAADIGQIEAELGSLVLLQKEAHNKLGELEAEQLSPLEGEAKDIAEEKSMEVIESTIKHMDESLRRYPEDEQDSMLPTNFIRQEQEQVSIETRLAQLGKDLEGLREAAERARDEYQKATRRIFRAYFKHLTDAAKNIDFHVEGRLEAMESGRFRCDIKIGIGDKAPVHHDSQQLSGGQKAALSILMGMTAVSLEEDGAGFFLIDEPFSNSDLAKINELGRFLERSGAQYLVSMPTTADLDQCGDWLAATWICTRSRGGNDASGRPVLASPLKTCFAGGSRK